MNCECIMKIDARMQAKGMGIKVSTSLMLSKKGLLLTIPIPTTATNGSKKKTVPLIASYCPFCGVSCREVELVNP